MADNVKTRENRLKRATAIALVNLVVIAAILAAAEAWFRRRASYITVNRAGALNRLGFIESYPESLINFTPRGKRLFPDTHVIIRRHNLSGLDVPIDTNSLGFRDDELAPANAPNEVRVLVLGDSITMGEYLPADQVWVERMQVRMQEARPDLKINAINAGIYDIGMREEVDILDDTWQKVQPDLVLLAFYLNDSRPPQAFPEDAEGYGFLRRHFVLAQVIYRQLVFRQWVSTTPNLRVEWWSAANTLDWLNNPDDFRRLAYLARYDWGAAWQDDSWPVIGRELDRLKALSDQGNFQVAVAMFPVSYQVNAHFLDDLPQKKMTERATKLGFPVSDLLPMLREHTDEQLFYDHCHPRPHANDLIATQLSAFILPMMPPKQ